MTAIPGVLTTIPQTSVAPHGTMDAPLLALRRLQRHYTQPADILDRLANLMRGQGKPPTVQAVAGVDLDIRKGEVLGIVGESGCGKSTLGRLLTGILQPSAGEILYRGQPLASLSPAARRDYALGIQMIFQDPFSSLNPRMRVRDIIGEAPVVHGLTTASQMDAYVVELMQQVGLDPAYRFRYPHQFSGGQRQRIGIARALALKPSILVCDEAVAALDVSIQAQVLNLFMQLRTQLDLTYFFISHNLGVVSHISDRVAIMYLGRIVEIASTDTIFQRAHHPYTQALLKELPSLQTHRREFATIRGELPSPLAPPSGCPFHPRCVHAMPSCTQTRPALRPMPGDDPGHQSACHLDDTSAVS